MVLRTVGQPQGSTGGASEHALFWATRYKRGRRESAPPGEPRSAPEIGIETVDEDAFVFLIDDSVLPVSADVRTLSIVSVAESTEDIVINGFRGWYYSCVGAMSSPVSA